MKLSVKVACVITILALSFSLQAQHDSRVVDEQRNLPIPGTTSYSLWSTNSDTFTFVDVTNGDLAPVRETGISYEENITSTMQEPYWEAYYPGTGRYVIGYDWPAQPILTEVELEYVNPMDIVRISPDGSGLLYTSSLNSTVGEGISTLRIFNRETQTEYDTGVRSFFPTTLSTEAIWSVSDDSIAVKITNVYGANFYYIDSYLSGDANIFELAPLVKDEITFLVGTDASLFDISNDGSKLLINALELSSTGDMQGDMTNRLIVWDPRVPEESQVINGFEDQNIVASAFVSDNSGSILVVLSNGDIFLLSSDLSRREVISSFGQDTFGRRGFPTSPQFSPDGAWLAYFSSIDGEPALNIVDIAALLQTAMLSPDAGCRKSVIDTDDGESERIILDGSVSTDGNVTILSCSQ